MKNNNRIVSENTESINGVVVTTVTTETSTRFYIVNADGSKSQLSKADYFEMLSDKSKVELETAKIIRATNAEYRAMSYGDFTKEERTKAEWHYWMLENRDATEKVAKMLPMFDEYYFIEPLVNEEEDKVFNGGWLYRKGDMVGFIDRFIDSKSNLQITLHEDGVMKHWDQTKRSYVVGMFKHTGIDVGMDLVSNYWITPELTDEQQMEIVLGDKSEQDFSSEIHVYRVEILGLDCLAHWHIEEDRMYFVEELSEAVESDGSTNDNEEEL